MLRKHLGKLAKESAADNRPKTPEPKNTQTEVVSTQTEVVLFEVKNRIRLKQQLKPSMKHLKYQ